ncbi:MAG: methyltransferase family protein [Thermoplasmata archaeon]
MIILPDIQLYIFLTVLITAILEVFGLILTLLFPKLRIWPPPGKRSWQIWFVVGGWGIMGLGVVAVGILDWETFWLMHWSRLIPGGLLASFGLVLNHLGSLGTHQDFGLEGGPLRTDGPFQYTRNPQYVGLILAFTGMILITNSFWALITGILIILWLLLAPFSEEPWLREQFGKEYEEYCKNVPRFIGRASFKRKSPPTRRNG